MRKPNANSKNSKGEKIRTPKAPKKITESYLHNSGLYYLERYNASSGHFKTVMLRKVKKSCLYHKDQSYEECSNLVDKLVDKFLRAGLLNDDLYLQAMVASYRRKGLSERMIVQKLAFKKLPPDKIKEFLAKHDDESDAADAELQAAAILCRKKKMGAFALKENDPQKELSRLGRAGFSFDIARKVLEMKKEELERLIY